MLNVSFELCDIEEQIPGQDYDAIIDSQTLCYVRRDTEIIRRLRDALSPGGILISVPALCTVDECHGFIDLLRKGGLVPTSFSMTYFRDRGELSAYPVIVAEPDGKSKELNVRREYTRAVYTIRTDCEQPQCCCGQCPCSDLD